MYELNEIDGMVEAIFMVMDEHGILREDGHWLTEEKLLRFPEAKENCSTSVMERIDSNGNRTQSA